MAEPTNRKYAVNPETGQVMRRDETGWVKVQSAKNQAGDILIKEDGRWGPVPGRSADVAPAGFASIPKMSIGKAAEIAGAQGREVGLSDEARGFRAMAGVPEWANTAYQAVNPLGRFTSIGTGLAGLAGEAMGAMPETYTQARDVGRQELAQARADRPITSFLSEAAQAAVYPAGTLRMGAPLVMEALKLGGIGALQGGLMGYAAGEGDTEDRIKTGSIGAGVGFGLGAAMPGAAAAALPVYRAGATAVTNAADALIRLFGGTSNLADANARRVAEAAVRRSMERSNMTPEQLAENLERFRDKPAVLAEIIGQDALNALTALTRRPGATPEMAQDIIAGRFGGLGERIAGDVRQAAPNVSEEQIAGEFGPELAKRRAEAAPAYSQLFEQQGNVMSPRLMELIDTDTMRPLVRTAISRVREKAIRERRNPDEITPLEVLDYAKQRLDDRINIAKKNKQTTLLADLTDLKNQVVSELDDLTGGQYAAVRELGGEAPRLLSAKDLGEKWRTIRLPQFLKDLKKINPQDRSALQAGIVAQIDDRLNRGTLNPREFRTKDVQEKIRAVFGPEAGDELIRRVTAEAELRETGARFAPRVQSVTGTVAENAPEEFLNDAIGVVEQVRRGNIAGTMQAIGSFMRRRGYGQRQIDEMGRLLLSDPEEGLRRLGIRLPTAPGGSAGGASGNAFAPSGPTGPEGPGGGGIPQNAFTSPEPGPLSGGVVSPLMTENAFTPGYLGRQSFRGQGPVTGPATQARMADWEATVPALAQVSNTGQQASEVAAQALQNRTPQALAEAQQAKAILRSEIEGIVQTRAGMATPEDQRLVDALQALSEQTNDPVLLSTQIRNARVNLDRVMESLGQGRPGNLIPVRTRLPLRRTRSAEEMARTIPEGRQSRTRYAGGTPPDETQMGLGPEGFNTSQIFYIGSPNKNIKNFEVRTTKGRIGQGVYATPEKRLAEGYTKSAATYLPDKKGGGKVYEVYIRGNLASADDFYKALREAEVASGFNQRRFTSIDELDKAHEDVERDAQRILKERGFTGFVRKHDSDRQNFDADEVIVFDSENVRRVDDPMFKTKKVKAKDIYTAGDSWLEWGWSPENANNLNVQSMGFGGSDLPKPVQQARQAGYQGADTGESKEWLSAVRKGLPMDRASRMARAQEQGYDTDTVLYHGTTDTFSAFDPKAFGGQSSISESGSKGVWLTNSQKVADFYGELSAVTKSNRQFPDWEQRPQALQAREAMLANKQIMPLMVRGQLKEIDMGGAKYSSDISLSEMADEARAQGYDGIKFRNFVDGPEVSDHVLIFDPKNIRSVNAAFDPEKSGSSTLLAAAPFAVGGVGAGAAMQSEQNAFAQ